jgi:hypothetical protein
MELLKSLVSIIAFLFVAVIVRLLFNFAFSSNAIKDTQSNKNAYRPLVNKPSINPESKNDSGTCFINTKESERAIGVKMKLYYPCKWEKFSELETNFKTLIEQRVYQINNTDLVGLSFDISSYGQVFTPQMIDKLQSEEFLKKATENKGQEFISWKKVQVQSFKGDQSFTMQKTIDGVTFFLINHIFYQDKVITITYMALSSNENNARKLFEINTPLFNSLFNKTEFLR